jgi:hypothetical protein
VELGTLDRTSGNNAGYANFADTDIVALTPGNLYIATLTPGYTAVSYAEYWMIWIDYNKDGDFEDAGELVSSTNSPATGVKYLAFTVPAGLSGATRMRIAMKYYNSPSPCGAFSYGEVEDYGVAFGPALTLAPQAIGSNHNTTVNNTDITLYPNPATNEVHVRWTGTETETALVSLTDLAGRQLAQGSYSSGVGTNEQTLQLQDLPVGCYLVNVKVGGRQYHERLIVQH